MGLIKDGIAKLDATYKTVLDYYLNPPIDKGIKVVIIYDKISNREDLRRHY